MGEASFLDKVLRLFGLFRVRRVAGVVSYIGTYYHHSDEIEGDDMTLGVLVLPESVYADLKYGPLCGLVMRSDCLERGDECLSVRFGAGMGGNYESMKGYR